MPSSVQTYFLFLFLSRGRSPQVHEAPGINERKISDDRESCLLGGSGRKRFSLLDGLAEPTRCMPPCLVPSNRPGRGEGEPEIGTGGRSGSRHGREVAGAASPQAPGNQ